MKEKRLLSTPPRESQPQRIGGCPRGARPMHGGGTAVTARRPHTRHLRAAEANRRPAIELQHRIAARRRANRLMVSQWEIAPAGNRSPWYLVAKRVLDLAGAVALLILLSPLLLAVLAVLMVTTKDTHCSAKNGLGFWAVPSGFTSFARWF